MKRTKLAKTGKSNSSKLEKVNDSLLTPIIKLIYPSCEACGSETQVAHHWIEKSRSSYLRYVLDNLIGLCHSCHAKIHNRFGNSVVGCLDVADIIIKKRGKKWAEQMKRDAVKIIKKDIFWYEEHHTNLKNTLDNLKKNG